MGFDLKNLGGLADKLGDLGGLAGKAKDLVDKLPLKDLLSDAFMKANTKFPSLGKFLDAAGVKADDEKALKSAENKGLDEFVASATKFGDWKEMLAAAAKEHLKG